MCTSKILVINLIDEYSETTITKNSNEKDIAKEMMYQYKNLSKKLSTLGYKIFMSSRTTGDKETFYLHCLRFYLPAIIENTYERHQLGLRIFTMEGFEYKNYTSKHVVNNQTNGRKHIYKQRITVLQLLHKFSLHNTQKELKEPAKMQCRD